MTLEAIVGLVAGPVVAAGTWVISVEKRLGILDSIDKKCDLLLEHLLNDKDQKRG
jgi:hypothetical protein